MAFYSTTIETQRDPDHVAKTLESLTETRFEGSVTRSTISLTERLHARNRYAKLRITGRIEPRARGSRVHLRIYVNLYVAILGLVGVYFLVKEFFAALTGSDRHIGGFIVLFVCCCGLVYYFYAAARESRRVIATRLAAE